MRTRSLISTMMLTLALCLDLWGQGSQSQAIPDSTDTNSSSDPRFSTFNQGNLYDPLQLIIGQQAGVSITRVGGDPTQDYTVRIRGINTFSRESRPLVVLNGVVGASLDQVDPNDIAQIEVLKESAATAFYGMRGANGVILVTTKKAAPGVLQVNASASVSVDVIGRTYDVLDRDDFLAVGGPDFGANTDWIEESTQTGLTENASFAVRQQFEKTAYSISANYRDIEGIVSPTFRTRFNAAFSLEHEIIDKLKVSVDAFATDEERGMANPLAFRYMTIFNPTAPVFDNVNTEEDGGFFQLDIFDFQNPVALLTEQLSVAEEKSLLVNIGLHYEISDALDFQGTFSRETSNLLTGTFNSRVDWERGRFANGIASRSTTDLFAERGDLQLTYEKQLNPDLKVKGLLGTGYQKRDNEGFLVRVRQFLFDSQTFNNLGASALRSGPNTEISSFRRVDQINSNYGRIEVDYLQSLRAYINVRSDAYSGFINNSRGLFYGFGVSYDLLNTIDAGAISTLTIRGSYGISGNLSPDPTIAFAILENTSPTDLDGDPNTTDDIFVNIIPSQNRNPELQWETVEEFNLGLDFAVKDWQLSGSVDYFNRESNDLIFSQSARAGTPNPFDPGAFFTASSVFTNFADLSSSGVEVSLRVSQNIGAKTRWTGSLNTIFYEQPSVTRSGSLIGNTQGVPVFNAVPFTDTDFFASRNALGAELGQLFAPEFLGAENGRIQLGDLNPVNWPNAGSALPSTDIGFFNQFNHGAWDLSFMLRGSLGHSLINVTRWFYENQSVLNAARNSVVTDKSVGLTDAPAFSSHFIEEASFLRLNYLSIGRSFTTAKGLKWKAQLIGQNLFTITGYSGIDPEVAYVSDLNRDGLLQGNTLGFDTLDTYFNTRTYTLSLSLEF